MNKKLSLLLYFVLIAGLLSFGACGDDDDNGGTDPTTVDAWIGTWLSAGDDVSRVLFNAYAYDSIYVEFDESSVVTLQTHNATDGWVETLGTYSVTESSSGDLHAIVTDYTAYAQEGIVEVYPANPDSMWLEVMITGYGLTIPTVELGFGADATQGTNNIQVYRRVN